jgi:molybdopterin biosynthesis enzyme
MPLDSSMQRISRLTPLATVLAVIESKVSAAAPRQSAPAAVPGATLAQDVAVAALPPHPIALSDGYAVEAATTADASSYAPIPLATPPVRVDAGEPLPRGADAVAPFDTIVLRGDRAEAIAAVAAGEGVLPAGADALPITPLRRAGERLRPLDVAMLQAAGVAEVTVRQPRLCIACSSMPVTRLIDAAQAMLVHLVASGGGVVFDQRGSLDSALMDGHADAVIAVGGTGRGRGDSSVRDLAQLGRVQVHGIAVSPGETTAFGFFGKCPVLLIPGRIDAVLTVWLLIGRYLVAKLAGGKVEDLAIMLPLKRKVTSTIGLTEVVPVSCAGGMAEPLASGYLSFAALSRSDGWIVIAADSEGCDAGTLVAVTSWP